MKSELILQDARGENRFVVEWAETNFSAFAIWTLTHNFNSKKKKASRQKTQMQNEMKETRQWVMERPACSESKGDHDVSAGPRHSSHQQCAKLPLFVVETWRNSHLISHFKWRLISGWDKWDVVLHATHTHTRPGGAVVKQEPSRLLYISLEIKPKKKKKNPSVSSWCAIGNQGHRFIRQKGSSLMDGTQSNARPIRCSPNRRRRPFTGGRNK